MAPMPPPMMAPPSTLSCAAAGCSGMSASAPITVKILNMGLPSIVGTL
jgi:hypothetical protein